MLAGMTSGELGDWHQFYREHYFQDAQLDAHFSGLLYSISLFFRDPELTPAHFSLLSPSGSAISDDEPDDDALMTAAEGYQEVHDMAQQISDLVINLDVDSATFSEQVARIKGS
jgi:phage tail assembly protein T